MPVARSGGWPRIPEPPVRAAVIAAGGALGTLARYAVGGALVPVPLGIPWPTLVVNTVGSFVLGLVLTLVIERWPPTRFVRPFVAIGFCGGFTTFSTMSVEAAQLGQHGRAGIAFVYLVASLVSGVIAVIVGMAVARGGLDARPSPGPIPDPDDVGVLGPDLDRTSGPDGHGDRERQPDGGSQ